MHLKTKITGLIALIILLAAACMQPAGAAGIPEPASGDGFTVKVSIPVSCDLGGTVKVTRRSADAPAPEPAKLTLKDSENGYTSITFTEPGIYSYRFSQIVKKKDSSIEYDMTPYDVSVFVASTDSELKPTVTVVRGSVKTDLVHFANKKKPAAPPKTTPAHTGPVKTGDTHRSWSVPAVSAALVICLIILMRRKGGNV